MYRAGKLTRLAGGNASATGINGVISATVDDKPAAWRSASTQPTMLVPPHPDGIGTATGVDEDGTIVGSVQSSLSRLRTGYEWLTDGTGRTLPVPAVNGKPVKEYFASAIRDGWVSGGSADPGRESPVQASVVLWNLGTGEISVTAEVSTSRSTPEAGSRAARSPTPRRTTSQHDQRRRQGPRRCSMRGRLGRRRGEIGGMAVGKDDRRQYGAHTL